MAWDEIDKPNHFFGNFTTFPVNLKAFNNNKNKNQLTKMQLCYGDMLQKVQK